MIAMRILDVLFGLAAMSAAFIVFAAINPYPAFFQQFNFPVYQWQSGYSPTGGQVGLQVGDVLWGLQVVYTWIASAPTFVSQLLNVYGVPWYWQSALVYLTGFLLGIYILYFVTGRITQR